MGGTPRYGPDGRQHQEDRSSQEEGDQEQEDKDDEEGEARAGRCRQGRATAVIVARTLRGLPGLAARELAHSRGAPGLTGSASC